MVSAAVHWPVWRLDLPQGFEIRDVEGDNSIPVEVLAPDPEPPPPPPPPSPAPTVADPAATSAAALAALRFDAGPADASQDASSDALEAATTDAARDGGVVDAAPDGPDVLDAALASGFADGGSGDGGSGDGGASMHDPEAFLASDTVRADKILVSVVINGEVIRTHPIGARLGYLLRGIPQWDEFMSGTDIDPVRDVDWVTISGASLRNTEHDTVLVRYNVADRVADHAIKIVSAKYDRGGPFDAGVPGVKATLAHADRAERVLLRPRPHLLAVVPVPDAHRIALQLAGRHLDEHPYPGQAMHMTLLSPHRPMPEVPESITVMRLRILPADDAGAEVFIEGDTKDAAAAAQAAEELRRIVRRHDDMLTSMVTHGLLDHVDVSVEGSTVKAHLAATRDQIESVVALVGGYLGVEPPAGTPTGSGGPLPPPQASSPRRRDR